MQQQVRIVRRRQQGRRKDAGGSVETHGLDAAGQQRAQRVGQPEFVVEIGRAAVGPRGAEQAAGIARGVDLLVVELGADGADQGAEWRGHRHELDFGLGFLGVVVKGRARGIEAVVVETQLVVVIFDRAQPEAHDVDRGGLRTKLALAGDLGLRHVDAGVGLGAVERGNPIDAGEARDRGAHIAAVEQVGAAHRLSLGMQAGVRLLAVERRRGVGREKIGVARDEIVAGMTAVEVGMHREIAGAGIEQGAAFETAVDRRGGAQDLGLPAAHRRGEGNAVVGGLYDAAHRLRAVAQRLRTAEDLDLLDRERIDRHAVVLAEIGDVHRADAVLLHADAEVVEPAQHRARRAGRKTG